MKKIRFILLLLFATIWSCVPDSGEFEDINETNDDVNNTSSSEITDLIIPANFNFETTKKINMEVSVKNTKNDPLAGSKVSFYTKNPDFNGEYITSAITDSNGQLDTNIQIPTYLDSLFVRVHRTGFANQRTVAVNSFMNLEFGGIPGSRNMANYGRTLNEPIHISDNYYYMGTFDYGNWNGLPHYLESEGDDLSQQFLDDIDASLPEDKPVPQFNPEYLTTGNELDVNILELSEVWVTFVSEGAGYRNTLGYYVFDSDNPPSNASEIDSVFVVLPNASFQNSGGQLRSGDKVSLGLFEAGKTISWVLFQNAYRENGVNVNATKYYSRIDFNTSESDPTKRQHTVQLADFGNQRLINGFEDLPRSYGQSDDDFNDLVFYVSANPWEGIAIGEIPEVTASVDTDGDGISDESDDFPNDPLRAIRNTYQGSLAFEDLWPAQGDYDFNDMVIDYDIDHILNGENLLVDIEAEWTIKALFATFSNGFGLQFNNLTSNEIANISGVILSENMIFLNGNGTEADEEKATIICFDNAFNVVQASGSFYPHTSPTTTFSTTVNFSNPVSQSKTGYPPYNPFIFVDGDRSKEIHLPGHNPTDHANLQWLGSVSDASNLSNNYTYKTSNGLPWAINISQSFDFPSAGNPINEAYYNFATWATSGGTTHRDWYLNLPGNRDEAKIHH